MEKTWLFIKTLLQRYPFSVACIAMIWVLSLVPFFPDTPLNDVDFADKWVHTVMYFGTGLVVWAEYWRCHSRPDYRALFLWAWLALVLMGGLLELIQANWTGGHRNGDWLDFAANTLGVTLAAIVGLLLRKVIVKSERLRERLRVGASAGMGNRRSGIRRGR